MSVMLSESVYYILYIGLQFNSEVQARKVIDIMNWLTSNLAIIG
jgi:hypothetical protein